MIMEERFDINDFYMTEYICSGCGNICSKNDAVCAACGKANIEMQIVCKSYLDYYIYAQVQIVHTQAMKMYQFVQFVEPRLTIAIR